MSTRNQSLTDKNFMSKISTRFYNDHEVRAVWDEEHSKW